MQKTAHPRKLKLSILYMSITGMQLLCHFEKNSNRDLLVVMTGFATNLSLHRDVAAQKDHYSQSMVLNSCCHCCYVENVNMSSVATTRNHCTVNSLYSDSVGHHKNHYYIKVVL